MNIVSNVWVETVVGGAIASILAAVIIAALVGRVPSFSAIYKEALRKICKENSLSQREVSVLQRALKKRAVKEAIETVATGPGAEAERLCQAIGELSMPPSQLCNPLYAANIVSQWLENVQRVAGTNKYRTYHDRVRDRSPYFDPPSVPLGVTATPGEQEVTLRWELPPSADVVKTLRYYHIERATTQQGPFTEIKRIPANLTTALSFTDTDLTRGTTYYYTLFTESKVLKRSGKSPPLAVTLSNVPMLANLATGNSLATSEQPRSTHALSVPAVSSTFFTPLERLRIEGGRCVGREEELALLQQAFAAPDCRMILIKGFGGLGKTTLGARFASDVSSHYHVLWLKCGGLPPTCDSFLREVGKFALERCQYPYLEASLGNLQASLIEKERALCDFLTWVDTSHENSHPIAFFFDDFHKIEDSSLKQLVLNVLACSVRFKLVLMIRFLPTELQGLVDQLRSIQLNGFSLAGCRALLEMYANDHPALKELTEEQLQHIWKLTAGVPTALKIFISLTRKLTIEDLLAELPRLTTATQVQWFDKLYHELSPREHQIAADISIFRRPTSRQALISVSSFSNAEEIIDSLQDRFLLTFDGRRYFLHDLWAEYTRQYLSEADRRALHRKAARFYRELASSNNRDVVMCRLESCYHSIEAEDIMETEEVLIPIAGTLRAWGNHQELMNILGRIERSLQQQYKRPLVLQLQLEKYAVLYAYGEVEAAIAGLKELIARSTSELEIKAHLELGWIYSETGNWQEAERCFERGQQLAQTAGIPTLEEEALYRLRYIYYSTCLYEKALEYDKQRLDVLRKMEPTPEVREAIAYTYHDLGNIYRERGYLDQALEYYNHYLELWQHEDNLPHSHGGWEIYDVGQIYRDQGRYKEAYEQFERALQLFEQMHFLYGIAHVKTELGRVGVRLGDADVALRNVEEAISILRKVKGETGEAYALGALGQIYLYLGQLDQALHYLLEAREKAKNLQSTNGVAAACHQIALVYERHGKQLYLSNALDADIRTYFFEARENILQAQKLYAEIKARPDIHGLQDDALRIEQACREYEEKHPNTETHSA
jgi:tetratricopeptide (TPR) repeat protein